MKTKPNHLRIYRNQASLLQADVAFLMGLTNVTRISYCENYHRLPSIDFVIAYIILFDKTIEHFFPHEFESIRIEIINRLEELLKRENLKSLPGEGNGRLIHLKKTLTRLTDGMVL